ncbi:MAG TPA: SBBP repeat-containing protein [Bryobacteraceae bacterium]
MRTIYTLAALLISAAHAAPPAISTNGILHRQNSSVSFSPAGFRLQWLAPKAGSLSMVLLNANRHAPASRREPITAVHNIFLGSDPAQWRTNTPLFSKIGFQSVYPGIDVVYYGSPNALFEYDFKIAPGARPGDIRLSFPGAQKLRLDESGDLLIGTVKQHRPNAYQQVGGVRHAISASYKLTANNEVIFELAHYDEARSLIIDPTVTFATFLGGADFDQVYAMTLDSAGNIFLAGQTASTNFPLRAGGTAGNRDIFIAKLDPTGNHLIYSTVLGGAQTDCPGAIAVDAAGNAYVAGYTSSTDFPVTAGAYQTQSSGLEDGFVLKLSASGALVYSTYLGAPGRDFVTAIAVDTSGNAYVAGYTSSVGFPIVAGAFQSAYAGGFFDAFVTKVKATGSALLYSTFIGGSGNDTASSIAIDTNGNAYIAGQTDSSNFPVSAGVVQSSNAGGSDAFVTKLNAAGSAIAFSTYLGGASNELGNAIAIDSSQNVYLAGATASVDFPVSAGAFQIALAASYDAFVTKLNSSATAVVFSTYLGGSGSDQATALTLDSSGTVWLTGSSSSTNFPLLNAVYAQPSGGNDAFVVNLNSAGNGLLFSSYFGGSGDDSGLAIRLDNGGSPVVAGVTSSANFPTTAGVVQSTFGGGYDGFILKLQNTTCTYNVNPTTLIVAAGGGSGAISATSTSGCNAPGVSSNVNWASVSITGSTANWSVAANPSSQNRNGALTIAGQTVTIAQAGAACSYAVNPSSVNIGPAAASGNLAITATPSDCSAPVASSNVPWASVAVPAMTANWSASANSSPQPRAGNFTIGGQNAPVTQSGATGPSTLSLSRSSLNFGTSGSLVTSPQTITINFTGPGLAWTASSNQSTIAVSTGSGTGNGAFQVTASAGPSGVITVSAPGAANPSLTVQINVAAVTPGSPAGSFDTPASGTSGIAGAIPVTGWALDNIEVVKVDIWRESIGGEPQGLVYIGDAVFVSGARPDVEAGNAGAPFNYRGGWGYLLLTNFLPNNGGSAGLGNGTYKLHAIAHNKAGSAVDLGAHTITVDNAHATRPFGSIDTPGQGGTASGNAFINFGWALTQNPYFIATDGSTLTVQVDGAPVGRPTYNQFRSDLATIFPGLANSNGAVGFYYIDTTLLSNGVHTLAWVVYDNAGRGDGIGSRYFTVFNVGGGNVAVEEARPTSDALTSRDRKGAVQIEELERIELDLGAVTGHLIQNGHRRPLPIGSTLVNGVFYWQPGPGFLGEFHFNFERPGLPDTTIAVIIHPKRFK